jgi:hypothetical protein
MQTLQKCLCLYRIQLLLKFFTINSLLTSTLAFLLHNPFHHKNMTTVHSMVFASVKRPLELTPNIVEALSHADTLKQRTQPVDKD